MRERRVTGCAFLVVAALVAGCSSTAVPAATTPSPTAQTAPVATGAADTQAELNQVVAAAKAEGKVTISGPVSDIWRNVLTSFQDDYPGMEVEYNGDDSRTFWPKLADERAAGQYLWDLRVGGPDPQVFAAEYNGTLDPVRPLLFFPDVVDDSKWKGGFDALYADNAKEYMPGFLSSTSPLLFVNSADPLASSVKSEQDLLNPALKGKIVLQDPRGGAGLGDLTVLLKVDGEDYVRQLLSQQDLVVSSDNRQIAEWLVRDVYPIAIGARNYDVLIFQQQGLGQDVKPLPLNAAGISMGSGGIQLINRAPHPNATKLFVNWLLTAKVQQVLTQAIQDNSARVDVPPGNLDTYPDPSKMDTYVPHQTETLLPLRTQAQQMAAQLLTY